MGNIAIKISIVVLISFLMSCYTRKEACLDVLASNYDVSADDACPDCCTFPKLKLEIQHFVKDSVYKSDSFYVNELNQAFKILDVRYYLHSFELFNNETGKKVVLETIKNQDSTLIIPDDIKIYRSVDASIEIGSLRDNGTYDSLTFYLGLKDEILTNDFINLPSTHVLLPNNRLKNLEGDYAHFTVRIEPLNTLIGIRNFQVTGLGISEPYTIKTPITTTKGVAPSFKLKANYDELFKNIDITDSTNVIENALKQNIKKVLIVN